MTGRWAGLGHPGVWRMTTRNCLIMIHDPTRAPRGTLPPPTSSAFKHTHIQIWVRDGSTKKYNSRDRVRLWRLAAATAGWSSQAPMSCHLHPMLLSKRVAYYCRHPHRGVGAVHWPSVAIFSASPVAARAPPCPSASTAAASPPRFLLVPRWADWLFRPECAEMTGTAGILAGPGWRSWCTVLFVTSKKI